MYGRAAVIGFLVIIFMFEVNMGSETKSGHGKTALFFYPLYYPVYYLPYYMPTVYVLG